MTIKKVTQPMYKCSDGKIFETRQAAEDYELNQDISTLVQSMGLGMGGSWDSSMIAEAIYDHRDRFKRLFSNDAVAADG